MSSYTYKQESKNQVRHTVIRNAVELLTKGRSEACCVAIHMSVTYMTIFYR